MRLGMQDACMGSTPVILGQQDWVEEKVNLGFKCNVGWDTPEESVTHRSGPRGNRCGRAFLTLLCSISGCVGVPRKNVT